jgi:hypothetical protein
MLLTIECAILLVAIALAFVSPNFAGDFFKGLERGIAALARRRYLSIVAVGGSALLIRLLLLAWFPTPVPEVHDEFSYLLMADTFARGRLANPTHPMWVHFETFHEIQKPTYASMYYPAQGLFLALGKRIFGHPFWGVSVSAGLMCAAICWMLQAWVPPFWALIGGWLAVIRIGTVSYWANSYWGGAVAALGGALVLGALPRLKRRQRIRDALLMSFGFALLANTRPYEGIFFSIPIFASLLIWGRSHRAPPFHVLFIRILVPLVLVATSTLVCMGCYFARVTGSAFRPPFFLNLATYNPVPYFPWQSIKAIPVYHHVMMENFYMGWWKHLYELGRHHFVIALLLKSWTFSAFFLGPLFGVLLIFSTFTIPYGASFHSFSNRTQFMLIVFATVLFGAALPVYFNPHYVAAITAGLYFLIVTAMRRLRRWRPRGHSAGLAIVRSTCAVAVLMLAVLVGTPERLHAGVNLLTWCSPAVYRTWRSEIQRQLLSMAGNHLLIVSYDASHPVIDEWVFNDADIDGSRIVWARDMGKPRNKEIVDYFSERKVWIVHADDPRPQLLPYAESVMTRDSPNASKAEVVNLDKAEARR